MDKYEFFIKSHTLELLGQPVVRVPFSIFSTVGEIKVQDGDVINPIDNNGDILITLNSQVPESAGFLDRMLGTPRVTINIRTITMLKDSISTVIL